VSTRYVPALRLSPGELGDRVEQLAGFMAGRRLVVLTGAGCSTESGIPDYRGPETRRRARSPIEFAAFARDPQARKRYWARATVGWWRFADKAPNAAHHALAELERRGVVSGVITQNVDDLHERAGSATVVPLHGSLSRVRCLDCGAEADRRALQARLAELNPELAGRVAHRTEQAPDGDAELPQQLVDGFRVVDCERCGGPLKPAVVFFGENVPPARVQRAFALCDAADGLLVVGSSLEVYSGLRFVRRVAVERDKPVAILNVGPTRGDALAALRIEGVAGEVLPATVAALEGYCAPPGRPA
jgi:NAD-dependent SIR2 family protein deacetylase